MIERGAARQILFVILILAAAGGALILRRHARRREEARKRILERAAPLRKSAGDKTFPRRYTLAAWAAGGAVALSLYGLTATPFPIAVSIGGLIGVIGSVAESVYASRRALLIEAQLSEAIDIMVGALRAGMSFPKALESAHRESREPIRPFLVDLIARIRMGNDPPSAFGDLARRIPLETFQLFAFTLSAQWWSGGSMASTLSLVGRIIRDRIEVTRRIQSQGAGVHVSVVAMMGISYALGWIMWRANQAAMRSFLTSAIGPYLAAGVIVLQAVGILWIRRISSED